MPPPVNFPPVGSRRPLPTSDDGDVRRPAEQRPRIESSRRDAGDLGRLASRQSLPSLPMSRARAQLWEHTRRPPDELLLPARLPASASRSASTTMTTAMVSGLMLPAFLPIPAAPMPSLPSGEAPDVAAARALAVRWLHELRAVATQVHREQASPDHEPDAFRKLDKLAAPAIVAALNAQDPGLRLVYAHNPSPDEAGRLPEMDGFGSRSWDDFKAHAAPGRWRVLLDNDAHNLSLDLLVTDKPAGGAHRASVLAFNPAVSPKTMRATDVATLAKEIGLPPSWPLLMTELPAQKSQRSCRIFALSTALKCRADQSLQAIHEARLRGEEAGLHSVEIEAAWLHDSEDSEADSETSSDQARPHRRDSASALPAQEQRPVLGQWLEDASRIASPQYMKHAQSRADLLAYLAGRAADAGQPVNRLGQTLLERHDAHRVLRRAPGWPVPSEPKAERQIYSASIELKRIALLDKALLHAASCEGTEALALAGAMVAIDQRWKDRYPSLLGRGLPWAE